MPQLPRAYAASPASCYGTWRVDHDVSDVHDVCVLPEMHEELQLAKNALGVDQVREHLSDFLYRHFLFSDLPVEPTHTREQLLERLLDAGGGGGKRGGGGVAMAKHVPRRTPCRQARRRLPRSS